ncbi:hypothetical protein AV530_015814 [Patagioenas fasciata monilis]|uniref:Uncharacterized protein n=1 Tax=Patagioenas fasciata monilis TaxID=372326 RepID=A0A1V4KIS7_PATFA|nr:hypothetical protein AV530_015814 [Patagioenas fasciata monilis]
MEKGECAFSRCKVSCQVKPWSAETSGAQRCCGGLEEPVRGSARSGRVGKDSLASSYIEGCAVFLSPPFLLEEKHLFLRALIPYGSSTLDEDDADI